MKFKTLTMLFIWSFIVVLPSGYANDDLAKLNASIYNVITDQDNEVAKEELYNKLSVIQLYGPLKLKAVLYRDLFDQYKQKVSKLEYNYSISVNLYNSLKDIGFDENEIRRSINQTPIPKSRKLYYKENINQLTTSELMTLGINILKIQNEDVERTINIFINDQDNMKMLKNSFVSLNNANRRSDTVKEQQWESLNSILNDYGSIIQGQNKEIKQLSANLVETTLDKSQNEVEFKQKINDSLKEIESLKEVESRFILGQKLLNEKNALINKMEAQLARFERSKEEQKQTEIKEEDGLVELSGILAIYKSELKNLKAESLQESAKVSSLQEQLSFVESKLYKNINLLKDTEKKYFKLKKKHQYLEQKYEEAKNLNAIKKIKQSFNTSIKE